MPALSQFTPVRDNEQFTPGKKEGELKTWKMKGI